MIIISTNDTLVCHHLMCRISFMQKAKKALKGNKMNTLDVKIKRDKKWVFPYMSNHFVERYYQRVFKQPAPKKIHNGIYFNIKRDMHKKMLDYEKMTLHLYGKSPEAEVPFSTYMKLIVKKNTLVTIF